MKNIYYIFLLAFAALLAGCSGHLIEPDGDDTPNAYIFLDAKVIKTKATKYDNETLPNGKNTSFGVFGVREDGSTAIFDNYTADDNSPFDDVAILYRPEHPSNRVPSDFIYDCLALWDGGENSFYAYYININGSEYHREFNESEFQSFCTSTRNVISDVGIRRTSSKVYMEYKQPKTLETMVDVMTAKTTTSRCDIVDLDFEHRLFAIDVIVRNSQIKDIDGNQARAFTFSNPKVTFRVPTGGLLYFDEDNSNSPNPDSLDVTYTFVPKQGDTFTIEASEKSSKDLNLNKTIENSAGNKSKNPFLFLPCESLRILEFSLTYEDSWGQMPTKSYSWKISSEDGKFLPGRTYQMIIEKKHFGSEFEFVPQIATLETDENGEIISDGNWDTTDDVSHTFN